MLLTDESHGQNSAGRERDRRAEELLEHEDPLGVMPKGPVPEVGYVLLAAVEELVQVEVLVGLAAELLCRAFGVVNRMGHQMLNSLVVLRVSVKFSP
jgi:hypothetical protein